MESADSPVSASGQTATPDPMSKNVLTRAKKKSASAFTGKQKLFPLCCFKNETTHEAISMEQMVNIHIEKLPEGVYLATCEDIPGLVAQGRTVAETLEIARDLARKLIEAQTGQRGDLRIAEVQNSFDYPLILSH